MPHIRRYRVRYVGGAHAWQLSRLATPSADGDAIAGYATRAEAIAAGVRICGRIAAEGGTCSLTIQSEDGSEYQERNYPAADAAKASVLRSGSRMAASESLV